MRILLSIAAIELLKLPSLKLIGAALLLWIGVTLLQREDPGEGKPKAAGSLAAAICAIGFADLAMSLDNVIAVAGAAGGRRVALILGLGISIPIVIFGSGVLLKLMDRFPVFITAGAALLGWVAGGMASTDPAVKDWMGAHAAWLREAAGAVGAILVLMLGKALAANAKRRRRADRPTPPA